MTDAEIIAKLREFCVELYVDEGRDIDWAAYDGTWEEFKAFEKEAGLV